MSRGLSALACAIGGALAMVLVLGVRPALVAGRSMEPALVPGDLCIASPWAVPRRGDIVLFGTQGTRPVLHRVVGVGELGTLRTKGDANSSVDREPVAAGEVRGRVVTVVPFGRALRGWLHAVRDATLLSSSRYSGDDGEALARLVRRPGRGLPDCKGLRRRCERFTPSAVT